MTSRKNTCLECGRVRWMMSRQLCKPCFRDLNIRAKYPPQQDPKPSCHPDRKRWARGLCQLCYTEAVKAGQFGGYLSCTRCDRKNCKHLTDGLCQTCLYEVAEYDEAAALALENQRARRRSTRQPERIPSPMPREWWYGLANAIGSITCGKCRAVCGCYLDTPTAAFNGVQHICRACGWRSKYYYWQESGTQLFAQPDDRLAHLPSAVVAEAVVAGAHALDPVPSPRSGYTRRVRGVVDQPIERAVNREPSRASAHRGN